jgi:hypothetical protein
MTADLVPAARQALRSVSCGISLTLENATISPAWTRPIDHGEVFHRLHRFIHRQTARRRPAHGVDQSTIPPELGERAPIETHLLADSAEAVPDRVVDLLGGKIDELTRQLGDEPFEFELLLERGALRVLQPATFGNVHDGRQHEEAIRRPNWLQPDLSGELRTVLAPGEELTTGAHGA